MSKAGGIAGDHLKSFIERIERLEEEKKALADDIRDVYSEAKANGFFSPSGTVFRQWFQSLGGIACIRVAVS